MSVHGGCHRTSRGDARKKRRSRCRVRFHRHLSTQLPQFRFSIIGKMFWNILENSKFSAHQ